MKYKSLTTKETNSWLHNLDQSIKLYEFAWKYYDKIKNIRREEFNTKYMSSWRKWTNSFESFDEDVFLGNDGKFHAFGKIFSLKITPYNESEIKLRKVLYSYSHCKILNTFRAAEYKWNQYAEKPFGIEDIDLDLYIKISNVHKEIKELLTSLGVYDERFNLDENCNRCGK